MSENVKVQSSRRRNVMCECSDPMCPVHGIMPCEHRSTTVVVRVDMEDLTGTAMCQGCASDAMDSGLFSENPRLMKFHKL